MGTLPIFTFVNPEKVCLIRSKIYETCLQLLQRCLFLQSKSDLKGVLCGFLEDTSQSSYGFNLLG